MHRNRWPSRACARRPPATGTWRGPRLSTHGATAGLVAVLLGLTTVAEGVEDGTTCDSLGAMGCDVAQGYYVCRPMAAEPLEAWFDATVAVRA